MTLRGNAGHVHAASITIIFLISKEVLDHELTKLPERILNNSEDLKNNLSTLLKDVGRAEVSSGLQYSLYLKGIGTGSRRAKAVPHCYSSLSFDKTTLKTRFAEPGVDANVHELSASVADGRNYEQVAQISLKKITCSLVYDEQGERLLAKNCIEPGKNYELKACTEEDEQERDDAEELIKNNS